MIWKQWEHLRDEPDLQQRPGRRAASNHIYKILVSLINNKRRLKHVSNVSDNKNERIMSGSKKGVDTRSYLSK